MPHHVLRVRLVVRLLGIFIACEMLYALVRAVGSMFLPPKAPLHPEVSSSILSFFWWTMDSQFVLQWLVDNLIPLSVFFAGVLLAARGSRLLERKILRAIPSIPEPAVARSRTSSHP